MIDGETGKDYYKTANRVEFYDTRADILEKIDLIVAQTIFRNED